LGINKDNRKLEDMRVLCVLMLVAFSFLGNAQENTENPNSLKGTAFKDRVYFGGNLGLNFGDITVINVAPIMGYKLNKKLSVGLGAKYIYYRERYPDYNWNYSTSFYGGSVFSKFSLTENIYLHGEFEALNSEVREFLSTTSTRKWVPMGFVGAGYKYGMGAISFQLLALYDIIDSPYSPYRGQYIFGPNIPVIIRGGIVIGL
jgi:outer membrane protein assembly factor BamA